MKRFWFPLAICFCSAMTCTLCADQAEEEAAIRKCDDAYVEAYNNHDAKALAAMWSPEAVYVDPETGEEAVGREEIEKEFADTFEGLKDAKLEIDVEAIKFLSPNVAVESGTARILRPNEEPDESTYSALFVKRDGKWLLDRVTEEEPPAPPAPPPSNYEHLKDLEWMVGSWIDNDEDERCHDPNRLRLGEEQELHDPLVCGCHRRSGGHGGDADHWLGSSGEANSLLGVRF